MICYLWLYTCHGLKIEALQTMSLSSFVLHLRTGFTMKWTRGTEMNRTEMVYLLEMVHHDSWHVVNRCFSEIICVKTCSGRMAAASMV